MTARVIAVLATLGVVCALLPGPAAADSMRYEVRVDGLACPFCTYGLERKLREIPGVDRVEVELSSGTARFDVADNVVVLPSAVRTAVREAGFTVGGIRVTATGEVRVDGDVVSLVLGDHRFVLRGARVRGLRQHPGRATITGTVQRVGSREVLTVEQVRST